MPTIIYTMSLAAHVADFRAAVLDTSGKNPHEALSLLYGDAVAQIMSFVPFVKKRCCLGALSPQMRLDSELGTEGSYIRYSEPKSRVSFRPSGSGDAMADEVPFFSIVTSEEHSTRQRIVLSLWWASRCGLPVELSINSDDFEMVAHLKGTLGSRVQSLEISFRDPPVGGAGDAARSSSAFPATALASLLSFPSLQSLSIKTTEHQAVKPLTVETQGAVEAATSLSASALGMDGCNALLDFSLLAGSRYLRSLTVNESGLRTLGGLSVFPMLEKLTLVLCPDLSSVCALADLPRLEEVEIRGCNLQSLDGLDCCVTLRRVDVSENRSLQSLSPLAGARLLRSIDASDCDIGSVQGLGTCAALARLILNDNPHLQSLGDLSRAPCLQTVLACFCDPRDLGEADTWHALREIDVDFNVNLESLSSLAGAPLLEEVHADDSGIHDFTVLESCPKLSRVFKTEANY